MQVTCPKCSEPVPAGKINMQQMAAVCPVCHTVFGFDVPSAKGKRRKVKQPLHMTVHDSDQLHMTFRTNFRLDRNAMLINAVVLAIVFAMAVAVTTQDYFTGEMPFFIPLAFFAALMLAVYQIGLTILNRTHIDMDEESIRVSRKPIPNPLRAPNVVSLTGIDRIHHEETPISKREGYDTPRYHIWAETVEGRRNLIISDVIEEYAVFIAQKLNQRLADSDLLDFAHLNDDAWIQDDDASIVEEDGANYHRYSGLTRPSEEQ